MATTKQVASLRKPATAAARGVTLATHAAAGLADAVHRDAARLLRASEGLARAALALLVAAAKQPANTPRPRQDRASEAQTAKPDLTTPLERPGESDGEAERKTGADAVQPGSTPEEGGTQGKIPGEPPPQGVGKLGSRVKPIRRKKKKKDGNQVKKGVTKNYSDEDGKGKEKTVATPVATAKGGEMDLDDRWADQASVPPASTCTSVPMAKPRATASEENVPTVAPSVTVDVVELGFEDTLLKEGYTATVVSKEDQDKNLTSEKGKLGPFDGKAWCVKMLTGMMAGEYFDFPSLLLQGHEGTVP